MMRQDCCVLCYQPPYHVASTSQLCLCLIQVCRAVTMVYDLLQ